MKISSFKGKHRFLSNFWPVMVKLDNIYYPSVEHAYQAAKTDNKLDRIKIQKAKTPGLAKKLGHNIGIRVTWEDEKVSVMRTLLLQKFSYSHLKTSLLATIGYELVEENTWGDVFWGVCDGVGQNMLGNLLMEIRELFSKDV